MDTTVATYGFFCGLKFNIFRSFVKHNPKKASKQKCQITPNECDWNSFKEFQLKKIGKKLESTAISYMSFEQQTLEASGNDDDYYQHKKIDTQSTLRLYACISAYKSRNYSELSLNFADRVELVRDFKSNKYVLVKCMRTKQIGYVPTRCIMEINMFLECLNII